MKKRVGQRLVLILLLALLPVSTQARRGCCSWHRGVCGCDQASGHYICCDGTLSPTCMCASPSAPAPPPRSEEPPPTYTEPSPPPEEPPSYTETSPARKDYYCRVNRIVDGDTLYCGHMEIRLIGIDTPESHYNPHIRKQRSLGDVKTIIAMGKRATKFVKRICPPGTRVRVEHDVELLDRYGRILAYIWLPDGRMLNEVIICSGYAVPLTIPPNVKYAERFRECYRKAREEGLGLWRK